MSRAVPLGLLVGLTLDQRRAALAVLTPDRAPGWSLYRSPTTIDPPTTLRLLRRDALGKLVEVVSITEIHQHESSVERLPQGRQQPSRRRTQALSDVWPVEDPSGLPPQHQHQASVLQLLHPLRQGQEPGALRRDDVGAGYGPSRVSALLRRGAPPQGRAPRAPVQEPPHGDRPGGDDPAAA